MNTMKRLFSRLMAAGMDAAKAFDIAVDIDAPVVSQTAAVPPVAVPAATPRRIGATGARVVYRLTDKARTAITDKAFDPSRVMFNTMARTFAAAVASGQPTVSQRELEALTGLGRKTIESTVYHLRTDGWLESVANGAPVVPPVVPPVVTPAAVPPAALRAEIAATRKAVADVKPAAAPRKKRRYTRRK